jgi:G3E family GTPase
VLIFNKTDLVSPADLQKLEARIRKMNSAAKIHHAQNASVPLGAVLNLGGFNLSRATELDPQFLEPDYPFEWAGAYPLTQGVHQLVIGHCDHDHAHDGDGHEHGHASGGHGHDHAHDGHAHHHHGNPGELDVVVLPLPSLEPAAIDAAIKTAVVTFSDWENRVKDGDTFTAGPTLQRLVLNEEHGHYLLHIPADGHYLVFEGCGEHPLHIHIASEIVKPVWQKDFQHSHAHEDDVTSVGISTPGDLDGKKLNDWIGNLLKTKGGDIYRMKGVLSVKGSNKRLVFQGVHMLFDAKFDREWGSDPRTNTLVFIGKNLDRAALNEGFKACLAG